MLKLIQMDDAVTLQQLMMEAAPVILMSSTICSNSPPPIAAAIEKHKRIIEPLRQSRLHESPPLVCTRALALRCNHFCSVAKYVHQITNN
jgi:hypothetical protein